MNRYVLKINNSTFVSNVYWMAIVIPKIQTNSFENAMIVTDSYLDYTVVNFGSGTDGMKGKTRKDLLLEYFPHIKITKVRLVIDDENDS